MSATLIRLLRFLLFPIAVLSSIAFWFWMDRTFLPRGPHSPFTGGLLLLLGIALVAWCNGLFAAFGDGTAHPFAAKTTHLVVRGPYRYVRNPMMWGVAAILAGLAFYLSSLGMWCALATLILFISFFVPFYEEPDMLRRFGDEYRDYCRRVPRWLPKFF